MREKQQFLEKQIEELTYQKAKARILSNKKLKFNKPTVMAIRKIDKPSDSQQEICILLLQTLGFHGPTWTEFAVFY